MNNRLNEFYSHSFKVPSLTLRSQTGNILLILTSRHGEYTSTRNRNSTAKEHILRQPCIRCVSIRCTCFPSILTFRVRINFKPHHITIEILIESEFFFIFNIMSFPVFALKLLFSKIDFTF
jgi:hypothetical protein